MNIEDIHSICSKYNITNYIINDDLSIDVDDNVYLSYVYLTNMNLTNELPLKFRNVTGHFECSYNNLTSLEGAPSKVGGSFYCSNNSLTSLEGIPLNLSEDKLYLPDNFTYSDYLAYCRDSKFKKLLK